MIWRMTPARAGTTEVVRRYASYDTDDPRSRGDDPEWAALTGVWYG